MRRLRDELVRHTHPRDLIIPAAGLLSVAAVALAFDWIVVAIILIGFGYGMTFGFGLGSKAVWRETFRHQLEQIDSVRELVEQDPPEAPRRVQWEQARAHVVRELERLQ